MMENRSINPLKAKAGFLIVLHILLGVGAVFGGVALVISPSGELLHMPLELLDKSPFDSFLLPGLLLTFFLGIAPLVVATGLIWRWSWPLAERFNVYDDVHWSWTYSLYVGFALVIWLSVQVYFLQGVHVVHLIYWTLGFIIQIVTLLPQVRMLYIKSSHC